MIIIKYLKLIGTAVVTISYRKSAKVCVKIFIFKIFVLKNICAERIAIKNFHVFNSNITTRMSCKFDAIVYVIMVYKPHVCLCMHNT